ncbi:MAG: EAL domain-containing protein [Pseudomonadota bacterium]
MLQSFTAALARAAPPKQYNALAEKALDLMPATAVVITTVGEPATIIGACGTGSTLSREALTAATAVPFTDPEALDDRDTVVGTPIEGEHPFSRVVNVALTDDNGPVRCMVFPILPGIMPRELKRFVAIGMRRMSEIALMRRYRDDLKRYVVMFKQMERIAKAGLWEYDFDTHRLTVSDEVLPLIGITDRRNLTRGRALSFVPKEARRKVLEAILAAAHGRATDSVAVPVTTALYSPRTFRVFMRAHISGDGHRRVAGVVQDVTEQHQAHEKLWWTANHDPLTGLANRALFNDRFNKALQRRARSRRIVCIVLVDVDKFKPVNDRYGHAAGDALLKAIAEQLTATVRTHDTVARTGGDEFSILLEDIEDRPALDSVLARIERALDVRFAWDSSVLNVTMSAGAAVAPDHGRSERDLTVAADLALYRVKGHPRAALSLYEAELGQQAAERSRMVERARAAVASGHILPYYQPQIDIVTGRVVAVEALARWETPSRVLAAGEFLDAIADHDIGPVIGRTVVDRAMVEIASLNRGRTEKVALSVNASAGDLFRAQFIERIGAMTDRERHLGPITIEITEDVVLDDPNGGLARAMRAAGAKGVQFALDDFGTGYASLIHITNLPISEIKIDRRFVKSLSDDAQSGKVIEGIMGVARSLGLRVVVEGIETPEQLARVKALGGQFVQGFYYARPVPLLELKQLLARQGDGADMAA